MNALTKFSIAPVTATAIAVYLYAAPGDEGFDAARSNPQGAICKQDGERLARLRARPSLDEGLRFVGEIRCMQLWPQLQTIVDGLSDPSRSTASSKLKPAASDTPLGSDVASPPRSTSSTLDDACKHDEGRLAELQAKPSLDEAIRFENEMECLELQPQVLALLDKLIQAPGAPSNTTSTSEAVPPTSEPPASQVSESVSVSEGGGAQINATSGTPPAPQAATDSERRIVQLKSEKEALPGEVSRIRHDQEAPSSADETKSTPSPQPPSPIERSEAPPPSQAAADAERRIAQLESEKGALAAEVSRLQQQASSDERASAPPSPPRAAPPERSDTPSASAAADAERRAAQLESENEALTDELSRLLHDREAPSADEAKSPKAPDVKGAPSDSFSALAALPTGMPPRVLIRYLPNNADARAQAEMLASVLKRQGIEVADLRESRGAIRPELSFSYAPDEPIALQVGHLVGLAPVRRPQPKDGLMVRPGTVELNLSGDSHLAAIKPTSTRESNHE
jgi:hypothetical protein